MPTTTATTATVEAASTTERSYLALGAVSPIVSSSPPRGPATDELDQPSGAVE
jgi:hypothetical protein